MRKNFGAKAILYPMPVLIIGTYDENGNPNAMNAAWGKYLNKNCEAQNDLGRILQFIRVLE